MNPRVQYYKNFIGQEITKAPSPFSNWLNGTIREVSETSISIEFLVREEMTNPVKMLHGGMMAAMIDDIIGMNIWILDDSVFYYTVSLHMDYISNVMAGHKITAKTHIVKKGGKVIHAECHLYGPAEKLLAKGTSVLIAAE